MISEIQRLWRGGILFPFPSWKWSCNIQKVSKSPFNSDFQCVVPGIGSVGDNMKCPRHRFPSGKQLRGWKTSPLWVADDFPSEPSVGCGGKSPAMPRQWEPKSWNESRRSRDTLPCAGGSVRWVRSGVTSILGGYFFHPFLMKVSTLRTQFWPILDHGFLQIPYWKWLMRVPGSWVPHFGRIWMSPFKGEMVQIQRKALKTLDHQLTSRPLRKVGNDSITSNMSMGSSFKVRPTHSVTDELVGGFYTQSSVRSGWLVIGGRGTARHQLGPWNYSSQKNAKNILLTCACTYY